MVQFSSAASSALASALSSPNITGSLQNLELHYFSDRHSIASVLLLLLKLDGLTFNECDLDLDDIAKISNVCCERNALFLDMNFLGDDGIRALLPGIVTNQGSLRQFVTDRFAMYHVEYQALASLLPSDGFSVLEGLLLSSNDLSANLSLLIGMAFVHWPAVCKSTHVFWSPISAQCMSKRRLLCNWSKVQSYCVPPPWLESCCMPYPPTHLYAKSR